MLELTDPEIRAYIVRLLWQHLSMYPDVVREIADEIQATGRYDAKGRPRHIAPSTRSGGQDLRFQTMLDPGGESITIHDLEVAYRQLREGCVVLEVTVAHFMAQSSLRHEDPRESTSLPSNTTSEEPLSIHAWRSEFHARHRAA